MVITLFKWMTLFAVMSFHPFYVCVTEVNYNDSEKIMEITTRIFTDDFEKTLSQHTGKLVSITKPKNKIELEQTIHNYFDKNLSLKVNGSSAKFSFIGFEIEDDAVLCYLQIEKITKIKSVEISNTLLHDFNKNQANIIHVIVGGERKSVKLDSPKNFVNFTF